MAQVASPIPMGGWGGPCLWSTSPENTICLPMDLQSYQSGPLFDLTSVWNSVSPRGRNASSMLVKPAFSLSIQPSETHGRKRRRSSAERRKDDRRPGVKASAPSATPLPAIKGPVEHRKPRQPTRPTAPGDNHSRAGDTLFSSIGVDNGRPYETKNICDLCRQPFETEEAPLLAHLSNHFHELEGSLSCKKCQITFAHHGDLEWHLQSTEHTDNVYASENGSITHASRPRLEDARFKFCVRLRKWEQAQLHLHERTIEDLSQTRARKSGLRSTSLPPRERKPVESLVSSPHQQPTVDSHVSSQCDRKMAVTDSAESTTEGTLYSLQQRLRDLMEKVQPPLPEEQDTPYSEFCDGHSLPGSPEEMPKDEMAAVVDRAMSGQPDRLSRGDYAKQAGAGYPDSSGSSTAGMGWSFGSHSQGQKRASDGRLSGQWQEDEADENDNLQPKKRKMAAGPAEVEKRFPCIYYVGNPVQFKSDATKYQHISNLCRHLKSHNCYVCSTCVLRFSNNEELEAHAKVTGHVRACPNKSCRRTKPAGSTYLRPESCVHITSAEEQWRELYRLSFNRQPPNIFRTEPSTPSHVTGAIQPIPEDSVATSMSTPSNMNLNSDALNSYGLTDSFFEQAVDFNLPLTNDSTQRDVTPFDVTEFLASDHMSGPQFNNPLDAQTGAGAAIDAAETAKNDDTQAGDPMHSFAMSLERKVAAIEQSISQQSTKEKDLVLSLQQQNVQLEQKLYQSSERERQLESILEVVFEALQATGAPQAQPNKSLWNLVMSHSSQINATVTSNSKNKRSEEQATVASTSFVAMSPSLTFINTNAPPTPPDSTFRSTR